MVRPHPRDVILYARSSYYYNKILHYIPFSETIVILLFVLVFNAKTLRDFCHYLMFLDVTSSCFPSLVPCLKFLGNVAAKPGLSNGL